MTRLELRPPALLTMLAADDVVQPKNPRRSTKRTLLAKDHSSRPKDLHLLPTVGCSR